MVHSRFTNSSGLPDPNLYTTPRDMAVLTSAIIRDFPQYYAWYSTPEFTYNNIRQHNRNRLLRLDPSVDGVKTGHTEAAGYCLVASAKRGEQRLISVVMGTPSDSVRAKDSLALLNWGFRFFETHRLYPAGTGVERLRVWSGDTRLLEVGPLQDFAVTIPRGRYGELSAHLEPKGLLNAPLARGDVVGDIVVLMGDQEVKRAHAVALQDVPKGGLLRQAADAVLKIF
jgi:D-alanyl-D-alanine carboxypeptidase (penicillin-binding protein 5/6)